MKPSPCYKCTREIKCISCHSFCEDYIQYKNDYLEAKQSIKKCSKEAAEVLGYLREDKEKRRRRG